MKSKRGVLLSVFLLIMLVISGLIYIAWNTSYVVVVKNNKTDDVEKVVIEGGGCNVNFGRISSGDEKRKRFWIRKDGALTFATQQNPEPIVVDGYVTPNLGGKTLVIIEADGEISIRNILIGSKTSN